MKKMSSLLPVALPCRGRSFLCLSKETNQRKDPQNSNLCFAFANPTTSCRVKARSARCSAKLQVRTILRYPRTLKH
jgi:hypothetical protein